MKGGYHILLLVIYLSSSNYHSCIQTFNRWKSFQLLYCFSICLIAYCTRYLALWRGVVSYGLKFLRGVNVFKVTFKALARGDDIDLLGNTCLGLIVGYIRLSLIPLLFDLPDRLFGFSLMSVSNIFSSTSYAFSMVACNRSCCIWLFFSRYISSCSLLLKCCIFCWMLSRKVSYRCIISR
jgi:hypothetical protein